MITKLDFTILSQTNNILHIDKIYFADCGISVEGTVEYCQTPKGIHYIVTLEHNGALLKNPKVDNIFEHNNSVVIEVLKQNSNLKPTLTLVYDITGMTNLNFMNTLPLILTLNKWNIELHRIAIPLGYKTFIPIINNPIGITILNRLTTLFPSAKEKIKTIYFKNLKEAQVTLNMIRDYGVV